MTSRPSALHTWLQLLRAPNLFTVPGDPLAGFLLASGGAFEWKSAAAILASLCFYAYGLLLNDLADLEEDRRDRPNRPLPSGAAPVTSVRLTASALALAAMVICWLCGNLALIVGGTLLLAISTYNVWAKRIAFLGAVNMGLCRGLSVLLGAAAALPVASSLTFPPAALSAALGIILYIATVTNVARHETLVDPPVAPRRLPFVSLVVAALLFFFTAVDRHHVLDWPNIWLYLILAYTLYAGFKIHRRLAAHPAQPIPPMIGQLIRLLLPLQAAFCVGSHSAAGGISAAVLLIVWPVSRTVSRNFYAS